VALESGFESVFVPYAPGDDGVAIGCAVYGAALTGELRRSAYASPRLGRNYDRQLVLGEDLADRLEAVRTEFDPRRFLADRLTNGAVVAWFDGRSEFGPRALGGRCFLADPRDPGMPRRLNAITKRREPFRPFAPVVLEPHIGEYFERELKSTYMSFVSTVRPEKQPLLPAITHVDGTARYQVLRRAQAPDLYALIERFRELTGIPMLLNTSLNQAGEPLSEAPIDAAECFLASAADYLSLNGTVYRPAGRGRGEVR
jgi:carbamoyltransferase